MHREPILPLTTADAEASVDLMMTAFNAPRDRCVLAGTRLDDQWVVQRNGRVVAAYGVYRCGLRVCGRDVPLGAVAGVAVAPEARGSGIASGMMASSLDALRLAGVPLAALYASTFALYRKVGYEQAGSRFERRTRAADIRISEHTLPIRAATDAELRTIATAGHGHIVRSEGLWARLLRPAAGRTQSYIVGEGEGWAVLWQDEPGMHFEWKVRDWGATTPGAARRLWTLLADASTMSDAVSWPGPPNDPMETLLPEPHVSVVNEERTMLRIVDLPAAMCARGWSADGEALLEITDEVLPSNAGCWHLRVRDGVGEIELSPVPSEQAVRMDIRGLAALYSGFHTAEELAGIGMLQGPAQGGKSASLDALFKAPRPWMSDKF